MAAARVRLTNVVQQGDPNGGGVMSRRSRELGEDESVRSAVNGLLLKHGLSRWCRTHIRYDTQAGAGVAAKPRGTPSAPFAATAMPSAGEAGEG